MLKEFCSCVPRGVKTFINERKVVKMFDAAVLADDCVLTHRDCLDSVDPNNLFVVCAELAISLIVQFVTWWYILSDA